MQVIDNFLPKDEFERLQEIVMYKIPYFFIPKINSGHDKEDNSCYLNTHFIIMNIFQR